jgi:putative FmdB family regulatory protein
MPAYEYQCNACESHFELRQKMSDPAIEVCPGCGGSVKRLISGGAAVISKGGSSAEAGAGCGSGSPCCGQGGCGNGDYCHQ